MNENPIKLSEYKAQKKIKKIIDDLNMLVYLYNLMINGLKYYTKYSIVQETVSVLQANKTLLEIHLTKYKNMLKLKNDKKKN